MRWFVTLSIVFFGLFLIAPANAVERRVALVMGNAGYTDTAELANTVNDAKAVAAQLEKLGFEVLLAIDKDHRSAIAVIDEFSRAMRGADLAMLFYAGHGIQIGGQNFMLPVDVDVSSERSLRYSAIDIQEVVSEMERSARVSVAVLDACRDNPFLEALSRSSTGTRSAQVERGLGPMQLSGRGAIIAYAAAAGQTASDGSGDHSPYTTALLEEISQEGIEIGLMFRRVSGRVIDATDGVQRPELLVRLVDEVYLKPSAELVAAAGEQPPAQGTAAEAAGSTGEQPEVTAPATQTAVDTQSAEQGGQQQVGEQQGGEVQVAAVVETAAESIADGRSARREGFFGDRAIYRPAWTDTVAVPRAPDWTPGSAAELEEAHGNDTYGTGQLIPLAAVVESRITPRGDKDWYRIFVPIAGELRLTVDAAPENIDLFARVWSTNRQVVRDWQGAGRAGGALDVGFALPEPGEYRVEVSDGRSDAESPAPFDLRFDYLPANDPMEPNNNRTTAQPLPLPAKFDASVYPRGDADWFRIFVAEPGLLTVIAEHVPENLDISMRLWNLDGTVVKDWASPGRAGGDTVLDVEVAIPGVYVIELVDGRSDAGSVETFSVSALFRPVEDVAEPNNSFGTSAATARSAEQQLAIFPRGDTDWLHVDVDHPGELSMLITNSPEDLDLHVRVWNAEKTVVRDWIGPLRKGGDVEAFVDLPKAGRYFIEIVDGRSDASSPDLFDLAMTFVPQPDQHEPNNSMAAAAQLTPGGQILFNILPRGDTDWFRVDVASGGELAIFLDDGPDNLDLHYRVWNAERQVIRDWVAPYRKGGLTEGFADLPSAGTYYIELTDGRSDDRSIVHATMKTVFTPAYDRLEPNNTFGTARPVEVGTTRMSYILPRGDTDWYLLEAPRAGAFLITVDQVDKELDIHVRIWDAEGAASSWVGPPRPGGVTEARLPISGPGRYRLEITDGRSDARSATPFRVHVGFE